MSRVHLPYNPGLDATYSYESVKTDIARVDSAFSLSVTEITTPHHVHRTGNAKSEVVTPGFLKLAGTGRIRQRKRRHPDDRVRAIVMR